MIILGSYSPYSSKDSKGKQVGYLIRYKLHSTERTVLLTAPLLLTVLTNEPPHLPLKLSTKTIILIRSHLFHIGGVVPYL